MMLQDFPAQSENQIHGDSESADLNNSVRAWLSSSSNSSCSKSDANKLTQAVQKKRTISCVSENESNCEDHKLLANPDQSHQAAHKKSKRELSFEKALGFPGESKDSNFSRGVLKEIDNVDIDSNGPGSLPSLSDIEQSVALGSRKLRSSVVPSDCFQDDLFFSSPVPWNGSPLYKGAEEASKQNFRENSILDCSRATTLEAESFTNSFYGSILMCTNEDEPCSQDINLASQVYS